MKYILNLLVFLSVFSCSPKLSPDSNWAGKKWVLYELKGNPVQVSGTEKDANLVFSPNEKTYSGSGGCNRITGKYTINSNKISLGEVAGTRMSCPDIAFEESFLATLRTIDSYAVEDNMLVLKSGNNLVMKLR